MQCNVLLRNICGRRQHSYLRVKLLNNLYIRHKISFVIKFKSLVGQGAINFWSKSFKCECICHYGQLVRKLFISNCFLSPQISLFPICGFWIVAVVLFLVWGRHSWLRALHIKLCCTGRKSLVTYFRCRYRHSVFYVKNSSHCFAFSVLPYITRFSQWVAHKTELDVLPRSQWLK